MKGTVVSTWIESSRRLYGDKIVNDAMVKNGLPASYVFNPLEDIKDDVARGIVNQIGRSVNKTPEEIWFIMGEQNIKTFSKAYPGFFRHQSAYHFLKSMNDVHAIVVKRINGSIPPKLDLIPISNNTAKLIYTSKRDMGDYLVGLVSGVAKYFEEEISVDIISKQKGSVELSLTFDKPIKYTRSYKINSLLSFGFIKSTSIKSAILASLAMLPISFIFLDGVMKPLIITVATFGLSYISNKLLQEPLKHILKELDKLSHKQFIEESNIISDDEYQDIMAKINTIKGEVQYDFIGFNSVVDEMYTFNHMLSKISKTMESASGELSHVLEDVAHAAITQAEDTEKAIQVLDDSVKNVIDVSNETQDNQNKVSDAVQDIENSFNNVKNTAEGINMVLAKFYEIKENSNQLKVNASNITGIVAMVAKIAKQINLLALNASIEAARAGEAGKGFVVVADEIKKLSEQTNEAVGKINDSLTSFVASIDYVVSDVDTQYKVLEEENKNLNKAVHISQRSNEELKVVSDIMVQTSQNLEQEVQQISTVFDGIQNLAAIAEENSASTEEASSNLTVYLEQINELAYQIDTFEKMIMTFQEELSKYII